MRDSGLSANIYWTINEAGEIISSLAPSQIKHALSAIEINYYNNIKILKRKQEWLLGRLTAKALITSSAQPLEGVRLNQISITNLPEGAPHVISHPEAGNISISHRESIAACAFIPDTTTYVGIDLEFIEPRQFSFVEDFFTQKEVAYIQDLDAGKKDLFITLIWSAKEAILKAWRKGLRLDTRHIEILPANQTNQSIKTSPWIPLAWKTDLQGYPNCWLGWQKWRNFVITLAVSQPGNSHSPDSPDIHRINVEKIYDTGLGA